MASLGAEQATLFRSMESAEASPDVRAATVSDPDQHDLDKHDLDQHHSSPQRSEWRPAVVRNVLLGLGALLLALAGLIFAVVNWSQLTAFERAGLLVGATAISAGTTAAIRRHLPATAEAISALGFVMLLVDWFALRNAGLGHGLQSEAWWAIGFLLTAAIAAGVAEWSGIAASRFASVAGGLIGAAVAVTAVGSDGGTGVVGFAAVSAIATVAACRLDRIPRWKPAALVLEIGGSGLWAITMVAASADAASARRGLALAPAVEVAALALAPLAARLCSRRARGVVADSLVGVATLSVLAGVGVLGTSAVTHPWRPLVVAAVSVIGVIAGRLHRHVRLGAGGAGILTAAVAVLAVLSTVARAVVGPLSWVGDSWHGNWSSAAWATIGRNGGADISDGRAAVAVFFVAAVAVGFAALPTRRLVPSAGGEPLVGLLPACVAGLSAVAVAAIVGPAAFGGSLAAAWAVDAGVVFAFTMTGLLLQQRWPRCAWIFALAGLGMTVPTMSWALATKFGTLLTLGGLVLVAGIAMLFTTDERLRAAFAARATTAAMGGAAAVATAAGGTRAVAGLSVAAVAAAAVSGARLLARRGFERVALELVGLAGLAVGVGITLDDDRMRSIALTIAVLGLGVAATRRDRPAFTAVATALAVTACWSWFEFTHVSLLEAYTMPPALAVFGATLFARRTRTAVNSWLSDAPGLTIALVPSLLSVLSGGVHSSVRAAALTAVAIVVLVVGARYRRQAPLTMAAGVLVCLAVDTFGPFAVQAPRWASVATAGLLVLWLGATAERRLAQLRRALDRYEALA